MTVPGDVEDFRGLLDEVVGTIVVSSSGCVTRPSATWPPLTPRDSKVRVTQMLEDVENALQAVQAAILRCDVPAASSIICRVKQLFEDASVYRKDVRKDSATNPD
jgi:hypothetical protein